MMRQKSLILKDKNILVTRAGEQAQDLAERLKDHGAAAVEIPMIEFGPPSSFANLDTALGALPSFDWIVFASSNAVSSFHDRLLELKFDMPTEGLRVAAIGSSTAQALRNRGIAVDFTPDVFVAEDFVQEFSHHNNLKDQRILWPRTNIGRKFITQQLTSLGAVVTEVESYSTNLPANAEAISEQLAQLIVDKKIDVVTLASSQTAKNFCHLLKVGLRVRFNLPDAELDLVMHDYLKHVVLAAIGPITADTTRNLFGRVDLTAEIFNADGLIAQLLRFYSTD